MFTDEEAFWALLREDLEREIDEINRLNEIYEESEEVG